MLFTVLLLAALAISVVTDFRHNKIYNKVCAAALAAGILLHWIDGQFWQPLAAALAAFAIFIPFYLLRGMSAGDVKLMTACASLLGWPYGLVAVALTLISGTIAGLVVYCARGGVGELSRRYGFAAKCLLTTGKVFLPSAPETSVAKTRFPYAIAIAAGCVLTLMLRAA